MHVYYAEPGSSAFRRLPGPGDLAAKARGTVRVVCEDYRSAAAVAWAGSLGLFTLRGGVVDGRQR